MVVNLCVNLLKNISSNYLRSLTSSKRFSFFKVLNWTLAFWLACLPYHYLLTTVMASLICHVHWWLNCLVKFCTNSVQCNYEARQYKMKDNRISNVKFVTVTLRWYARSTRAAPWPLWCSAPLSTPAWSGWSCGTLRLNCAFTAGFCFRPASPTFCCWPRMRLFKRYSYDEIS